MTSNYAIEGMTCQNCVRKVKEKLAVLDGVGNAEVSLDYPQLKLQSAQKISLDKIQKLLPAYKVKNIEKAFIVKEEEESSFLETYKPLILIVGFIAGVCFLSQYPFDDFSWMLFMRYFMAGFFIVFAFFKFLNLSGFADSYQMYDVIARRWKTWGYIYPFIELALGIAYLINLSPTPLAIITILILGISSIGVIQSNLNKEKIQCACLGDVFDLPMSVVTIIEDVAMILMAALMLFFA